MGKMKVIQKLAAQIKDSDFDKWLTYHMESAPKPKPTGKRNYVGIEIECYSPLSPEAVQFIILDMDLENYIDIADDGSIDAPNDYKTFELRILVLEKELPAFLKRLGVFLKAAEFDVNDTCGLHVHLDMRHRSFKRCYNRLLKFQDILFGMVDESRWTSEYCEWTKDSNANERFVAVNMRSFSKHETIEVRLHEGTLDVKRIGKWIDLLLLAIKEKAAPALTSRKDVLKWAGKNKQLKSYLSRKFNKEWFKNKERVMNGYQEPEDSYDNEDNY